VEETSQTPLEVIEANAPDTATYTAALLFLMPFVPIIATIISIATFVVGFVCDQHGCHPNPAVPMGFNIAISSRPVAPLLIGTLSALILWFLLACFYYRFTAVDRANDKSYYAIINHLSTLDYYLDSYLSDDDKKATLSLLNRAKIRKPGTRSRWLPFFRSPKALPPQSGAGGSAGASPTQDPMQEALNYRNALYLNLMQRSTSWITGEGYIALWNLMDSAEEALFSFAPLPRVVAEAIYDEMRLNSSKIENSEEWANKLRSAVRDLDPDAVNYLKPAVRTCQGAPAPADDQKGIARKPDPDVGRAILRKVREGINDFNSKTGMH
jgi:hypothetical protein